MTTRIGLLVALLFIPLAGQAQEKAKPKRDRNLVTCTGTARDSASFYKMYDQIRNSKEIADVKMDSMSGKNPLLFGFNFRWAEGGGNEGQ